MFTGLSAFPLTPMNEQGIKEQEFTQLVARLAQAQVDSIGVLGSTGSYAYLSVEERARVAKLSVESAAGVPVVVGIGALRTRDVLANAEHAQQAGAGGLLLAPVSYQKLTDDDVFNLFSTVSRAISVPLCVYDNPGTTHFTFSDELHGRIAELPQVRSIKIPPVPYNLEDAKARVARLRALIPNDVTIGISGDPGGINPGGSRPAAPASTGEAACCCCCAAAGPARLNVSTYRDRTPPDVGARMLKLFGGAAPGAVGAVGA